MVYITIYNFVTDEVKEFPFEEVFDAEEFASSYPVTEDEEISIGNEIFGMLWEDYLCLR